MTGISKRACINIGGIGDSYAFIDMFLSGPQWGPVGGSASTTSFSASGTYAQSIGADGLPNVRIQTSAAQQWGTGVRIPAGFQYGASGSGHYYVLRFQGNGQFKLPWGNITAQLGMSTHVTAVDSQTWKTTTSTVDSYFVFNYDGKATQSQVIFNSTDQDGVGATGLVRNVHLYRLDDETDFLAGKIFRTAFKQLFVDYCPGVIRFMDWIGGVNSRQSRFDSSRSLPTLAGFTGNYTCSPAYGATSGTNQMTIAAATATAGCPATPTNLLHGEVAMMLIGAGMARVGSSSGVTGVTKAAAGSNVVSFTSHGFLTGDKVIFTVAAGMVELNARVATVTVIDADSFSIDINTTSFTTFSGTAGCRQFVTLDVGSRGAYPVVFPQCVIASSFTSGYIATNDLKTFIFDKSIAFSKDASGNWVYGAWMFNDNGSQNPHDGGVPIEFAVQLINEINAKGPKYPIDMWINIPHLGVSSMDNYTLTAPFAYTSGAGDYTSAANYAVNLVNTIMAGANGYPGLTSAAKLHIEYSNETWNSSGGFTETAYLAYRGWLRWPASGTGDYSSMVSLRSVLAFEDVKASAAYSTYSGRIKFIMAGQGTLGTSGINGTRMDGTSYTKTDPLYTWGDAPANHYDHFAIAGYWDPGSTWINSNLPTATTSWLGHAGNASAQETDCANYLLHAVQVAASGSTETMDNYVTKITAIASKIGGYGGDAIMYEGGWNQAITLLTGDSASAYGLGTLTSGTNTLTACSSSVVTNINTAITGGDTVFVYGYGIPSGTTVTAASGTTLTLSANVTQSITNGQYMAATSQNAFLIACQKSFTMAYAQKGFFDSVGAISNAGFPAFYLAYSSGTPVRWGQVWPTPYGFGVTEWAGVNQLFQICGLRNNDKRRLKVTT